jgi:hypothetical protein
MSNNTPRPRPVCHVLDICNNEQIEVRNLAIAPTIMLRTYCDDAITADLRLSPDEAIVLAKALVAAAEHAMVIESN